MLPGSGCNAVVRSYSSSHALLGCSDGIQTLFMLLRPAANSGRRRAARRRHLQLSCLPATHGQCFRCPRGLRGSVQGARQRHGVSRVGDQGAQFLFRFCPCADDRLPHRGRPRQVRECRRGSVRRSAISSATSSVYDCRRHPWCNCRRAPRALRKIRHESTASSDRALLTGCVRRDRRCEGSRRYSGIGASEAGVALGSHGGVRPLHLAGNRCGRRRRDSGSDRPARVLPERRCDLSDREHDQDRGARRALSSDTSAARARSLATCTPSTRRMALAQKAFCKRCRPGFRGSPITISRC